MHEIQALGNVNYQGEPVLVFKENNTLSQEILDEIEHIKKVYGEKVIYDGDDEYYQKWFKEANRERLGELTEQERAVMRGLSCNHNEFRPIEYSDKP